DKRFPGNVSVTLLVEKENIRRANAMGFGYGGGGGLRDGCRCAEQRHIYADGPRFRLRADGLESTLGCARTDYQGILRQGERVSAGAEPLYLSPHGQGGNCGRRQQGRRPVLRSGRRDL